MKIEVHSLIGIFTIIDGNINIVLKNNDLLKVKCNDNLETVNKNYIGNKIKNINLKQCHTFSKKKDDKLTISVLFMDIVNYSDIKDSNINLIPILEIKDINKYINEAINFLKKELVLYSTIKRLYKDEFVLPEIQKIYENLLGKKFDRRNFRKRLIKLNVIEDLEKINSNKNGRPAKLYKFKDLEEDIILF